MAYVVNTSGVSKGNNGTGSAIVCPISGQALEDDVAVAVLMRGNGTSATAPTGWETVTLEDNNMSVFYKNQSASPDTSVSIPTSSTVSAVTTFLIRGCDVSTSTSAYDTGTYSSVNNSTAVQITGPSITPANANSTVILGCGEPSGQSMVPQHGAKYISGTHPGNVNVTVLEDFQAAASATTGYVWHRNHTGTTSINAVFSFAMVDAGNSELKAYIDWNTSPIATAIHFMGLNGESGISASDTAQYDPTTEIPNITDSDGGSVSTIYDSLGFQANVLQKGAYAALTNSNSSAASVSGTVLSSIPTLTGKNICFSTKPRFTNGISPYDEVGAYFILSDQTNSRVWMYGGSDTSPNIQEGVYPIIIDTDGGFEWEDIGTVTLSSCDTIVLGFNKPTTDNESLYYSPIVLLETLALIGGTSTTPASMLELKQVVQLNRLNTVLNQGGQTDGQFISFQDIEIQTDYWDGSAQAVAYPQAYDEAGGYVQTQIVDGSLSFLFNVPDGASVIDKNKVYDMGSYHSMGFKSGTSTHASTTYNVSGATWLNCTPYLNIINGALGSLLIADSKEAVYTTLADCTGGVTFSGCIDTQAITITSEADFDKLANCTFTGNNRAIKITGDQSHTGSGWDDPNLTVSGNTYDIEYTGTTDFSIQSANTLNILNSSSGWLTVVTPVLTMDINSDTASTLIRYFEDDSQAVADSATGITLAYNYPDTDVVDIELVKQGYVPVNRQDVTPYDGDYDVIMDFDEAYSSSHGLTITSEYDYVRATKVLTINSDQNALDVRSSLADVIRSNSSYYNTPLLMTAIPGLTRVDLVDGATVASMSTWKGAGAEVFDAADSINPTEKWVAIKSVGTITGATTHYRQTDSGSSTALTLTNNVVDEALQYWDDPDHDGTATADTSGYLVIKSFLAGSKQGRVDVLANAGISALVSNLYTVPLSNAAHDYSGVDPGITGDITLIAGGTFGGKVFAYEIIDAGVNTGEDIADQLNYNAANNPNTVIAGGTGLTYFELSDMVIHNATSVETEYGYKEGTTPALVGFYVSRSSVDHPDFTRFQADDGTYYVPAVTSNISVTGMPAAGNEIRLQVHNETAKTATAWAAATAYSLGDKVLRSTGVGAEHTGGLYMVCTVAGTSHATTEPTWDTTVNNTTVDNTVTWTTYAILYYDADPVGAGYADSYTDGEQFATGDTYRIRFAELNTTTSFKTYETTGLVSSTGFTVAVSVVVDSVYASNAVDGSSATVTNKFSPDYTNNEIDLDTNTDFAVTEAFAYYCYELTTTNGMYTVWGAVDGIDSGNYRNNVSVFSIYFDETAGFVKQTDSARWFRDDDTRPAKDPTTGGAGLEINWRNPVYQLETGVSGLTGSESTELFKNSTIITNQTDIEAKVDIIDANVDTILVDTGTTIPASIAALNDFDPTADAVANVTLVATTTTNTDMRGTDSANTTAPDNSSITAIKAKTDSLTFTKANEIDANIQSVNDVTVAGTGADGDEWGP